MALGDRDVRVRGGCRLRERKRGGPGDSARGAGNAPARLSASRLARKRLAEEYDRWMADVRKKSFVEIKGL